MGPSGFVEGFSEKGKIANLHESGGPTIISGEWEFVLLNSRKWTNQSNTTTGITLGATFNM